MVVRKSWWGKIGRILLRTVSTFPLSRPPFLDTFRLPAVLKSFLIQIQICIMDLPRLSSITVRPSSLVGEISRDCRGPAFNTPAENYSIIRRSPLLGLLNTRDLLTSKKRQIAEPYLEEEERQVSTLPYHSLIYHPN
jgi:hypothetical protein